MKRRERSRLLNACLGVSCFVALVAPGCGVVVDTDFANRLIGASGELIVAEDVDLIVQDQTLSEEEKRAALRDLGIEDEELIDALLTL